ncbi:hypothetical protein PTTG_06649, partial [Puccinia triticina 1-1 BBBD Race 1]
MSTRRTTSSDQLLPPSDREEILRRARAEQRRLQQAASTALPNSPLETAETKSAASHAISALVVGSAPASLPSGLQLVPTLDPPHPNTQAPMIPPVPVDPNPQAPADPPTSGTPGDPNAGAETKPSNIDHPADPRTNLSTEPPPPSSNLLTRDYMKLLMSSQHASITQAHADRVEYAARLPQAEETAAVRTAQLEEVFANLLKSSMISGRTADVPRDRVDLRRFNTANAPKYVGPYMEVEPFLLWINAVEIFFTSKDVTNDRDKVLIIGRLISETNLLSFFQAEAQKMSGRSWPEVRADLFDAALPLRWLTDLQRDICFLKMSDSESFNQYTTRARTLQRMINFDSPSLTDFQLAEGMTFGLPQELENKVKKLDILKLEGFKFKEFIRRVGNCYDAMPKKTPRSRFGTPGSTAQQGLALSSMPCEEYIWRIHSYLDSVGKCHHCKQHCGHAAGTCPGPVYRGPVDVPPTFIVPPKPADYVAHRAWNKS